MRILFCGCAVIALAACTPEVPDSAAGVSDYWTQGRVAPAAAPVSGGTALPAPKAISAETLRTLDATAAPSRTVSSQTAARPTATQAPRSAGSTAQPEVITANGVKMQDGVVQASPSNPAPVLVDNAGISDENDFAAVGARRSIESDAALRAQNKANYAVVAPTALPTRSGKAEPNIVAYALSTKNPVGQRIYRRIAVNAATRFAKNCGKYGSDDQAQSVFLSKGGPKVDRLGLDPDGDGFACHWDPAPFRRAAGR